MSTADPMGAAVPSSPPGASTPPAEPSVRHVSSQPAAPLVQQGPSLDALPPLEMARKAEDVGVRKANMDLVTTLSLAILAGAFIALGAIFSTTVAAGAGAVKGPDGALLASAALPYGVTRLLAGVAFSLGLILVVVAGAELFTGNVLLVMAWASGRVRTRRMLRNWVIVYGGNLVGALGTVALVIAAGWYKSGGGVIGITSLGTAAAKVSPGFGELVAAGILCNALVCLAVWLTYSARTTTDRILAIVPPIAAFVAAGFEHSIANMFFIPVGIAIRVFAPASFWSSTGTTPDAYASVDLGGLVANFVPVTLGNIIGGAVLVGAMYWAIYRHPQRR